MSHTPKDSKPTSNLLGEIIPEIKKLDALDAKEQKLTHGLEDGEISYTEYERAFRVINTEREILIRKLEKKGYFTDEDLNDYPPPNQDTYALILDNAKQVAITCWNIVKFLTEIAIFFVKGTLQLMAIFIALIATLMK